VLSVRSELGGRARLGLLVLRGVGVAPASEELAEETRALGESLRARFGDRPSGEVPGVEAARALYKSLGLDPTKQRPSSEALLRRVLKGEALYRVNTLVDALNLCSLRQQLPYGLYDLDRIEPPVVLRLGRPGESYEGIRKGLLQAEGKPVLADAVGPFGNPSADSARTQITPGTQNAIVVLYAPGSLAPAAAFEKLKETGATLVRFCGGEQEEPFSPEGAAP
jgi:DNA/RNA-binding domain of Phe-tRNA-synthetase-like protein